MQVHGQLFNFFKLKTFMLYVKQRCLFAHAFLSSRVVYGKETGGHDAQWEPSGFTEL